MMEFTREEEEAIAGVDIERLRYMLQPDQFLALSKLIGCIAECVKKNGEQ